MKPPHASDATLHHGWRLPALRAPHTRIHAPRLGGLGGRARLAVLAVVVLAMSLAAVAAWEFITGPLLDDPRKVGAPLDPPLAPAWRARRLKW